MTSFYMKHVNILVGDKERISVSKRARRKFDLDLI